MIGIIEKILIDDIISEDPDVKVKSGHAYTYIDGRHVPSVTTILSRCIHEEYIVSWANYLGFKRLKYRDELNKAAVIGTMGHSAIEKFLKDGTEDANMCLQSFRIWWDMLNENHKVEIIGIEESMILPYCGGTYDLLLKIDDRIFLADLKTSNHLSFKYFIQLAGYRHMLYKAKGINIDGCLILQLDKKEPRFTEQALDFFIKEHYNFIEHCAFTFMSLVLAYYNINSTEAWWKKMFD